MNAIGGGPPTEFPPGYPREVIETRLLQARERLEIMPRFAPVFAPPGNQIHPNLTAALRSAGYRGLSAASEEMSCHLGFTRIDVHLDLARGQGGRPFRGADQVLRQLAALASARRLSRQWDQPVGLLTHHLDHGEAAWRFLEALLDRTTGSRAVRWRPINALLSHALNRRSPAPMPVVGGRALQRAARR